MNSNAAGHPPVEPDHRRGPPRREEPVLAVELPAAPASLAVVRHVLAGVAAAVDLRDRVLDDLKVAVTEACTNVVLHAYEGAAERGPMMIELWHQASRLVVQVSDAGTGVAPRMERRAEGLGLGLRLIATLATEVRITTSRDEGTAVAMTFDLT